MGKIRERLLLGLIIIIGIWSPVKVYASEGFEIEQIQADMPEVTIYLRSEETPHAEELSIYMEEEQLLIETIELFGETGQGTDYFVLVDVSNSMPDAYVEALKVALNNFSASLNSYDKLVLMTFGEEVTSLLTGEETQDERISAIEQLHNQDNKTLLFEAIKQTADIADGMDDGNRKIVLVISDGEDFAVGTTTEEEAVKALEERNIPMYAMGISAADKEDLNQFGETARALGGTLSVFKPEETDITLSILRELWNNVWVVKVHASNNYMDNQMHTVMIKNIASGYMRNKDVMLIRYQPDEEAPYILEVKKTGDKQITVSFNENVIGADQVSAWSIAYEDENLTVTTATYTDKEQKEVVLTFEKALYTGEYSISAPGVCDDSMEKNVVADSVQLAIEGVEPVVEEAETQLPEWQKQLQNWWWLIIVIMLIMLVIVVLIIFRKIKKNKGIVFVNGKASLVSSVEERQHISIERQNGLPVTLELLGTVNAEKSKINVQIVGSLIVGRASICDLSLEDDKLSRQHFVLEHKGEDIFITDLQTTNGTTVNGVGIQETHKLSPRDVIAAGGLQMRITW